MRKIVIKACTLELELELVFFYRLYTQNNNLKTKKKI